MYVFVQWFIEVTAAIESAEMRRCQNAEHGSEHPRASSTDDVEGFFSLSRRIIGDHYTLKDFVAQWRKITRFVINVYKTQRLSHLNVQWCNSGVGTSYT